MDDAIRAALACVYDPCSVAAGRPISVIDLGLVTGWSLDGAGTLSVTFCVTFPGCTMAPHFMEAARTELARLPGVRDVKARVDAEHVWRPIARAPMLGKPQAWRERVAPGSQPG